MRAIVQTEFGGPEVLQLADVPEPVPAPGELLIDVALAGVNFADTHQRENAYVQKADLPLTPGAEVAGRRRDTGERVVALTGRGGYAEVVTAPEDRVFAIPDELDDASALALLLQGLTAWHLYRTMGRVAPGESVVVISGAGGVGSLAVQLGHPLGAGRVIATASTPEKRELCLKLGADAAVEGGPAGGGPSTSSSRWPAAASSTPRWRCSRRSGAASSTASPGASSARSAPAGCSRTATR